MGRPINMKRNGSNGVYEPVEENILEYVIEELAYIGERVVKKFEGLCNNLLKSISEMVVRRDKDGENTYSIETTIR